MKTFKFIVINKNNRQELRHFSKASDVAVYLIGRKLDNILIIVKEVQIVNIGDLGICDVIKIERLLNEVSAALP
jgi:hypothetical protein